MSSPNLTAVPLELEMAFVVKRALSILKIENTKLRRADLEFFPVSRHTGKCYLPFSALPPQRIWPDNELGLLYTIIG